MKNLIRLITFCVVMQISNLVSAYDFEVDGIYYSFEWNDRTKCYVVDGDRKYEGDIKIPEKVEYDSRTLSVTGITNFTFSKCTSLVSVDMPSATSLPVNAFKGCTSLVSVNMPNLTKIGENAFGNCSSLVSIDFPNLTSTCQETFSNCTSLVSVNLPKLSTINAYDFDRCTSLVSVDFSNVTYIGPGAFEDCKSLVSVDAPNVTTLPYHSFHGCKSLLSINFPNATGIGEAAFWGCTSLVSVNMPKLEFVGYSCFGNCHSLERFCIPGSCNIIVQFFKESGSKDKLYPTFEDCSLKELKFEYGETVFESVCDISAYPKGDYCSIGFYSKVKNLSWNFKDLTTYNVNGTLLSVEKVYIDREVNTFLSFDNLKELTLGEHVNSIQVNTPSETIICLGSTPISISDDYFSNAQYLNLTVKVPKDALESYQNAPGWKNFWNLQTIEDTTGIDNIAPASRVKTVGKYDLNGRPISDDYKGIVIVRYSDGSARKMIEK